MSAVLADLAPAHPRSPDPRPQVLGLNDPNSPLTAAQFRQLLSYLREPDEELLSHLEDVLAGVAVERFLLGTWEEGLLHRPDSVQCSPEGIYETNVNEVLADAWKYIPRLRRVLEQYCRWVDKAEAALRAIPLTLPPVDEEARENCAERARWVQEWEQEHAASQAAGRL